jgi:hypothetical protein
MRRLCICRVSDILRRRSNPRESRMENPIGLGHTRTSITLLYYAIFKRRVATQSPGHRSVEFTGFFKAFSPLGSLNMHNLQQQTTFLDLCCLLRLQSVYLAQYHCFYYHPACFQGSGRCIAFQFSFPSLLTNVISNSKHEAAPPRLKSFHDLLTWKENKPIQGVVTLCILITELLFFSCGAEKKTRELF